MEGQLALGMQCGEAEKAENMSYFIQKIWTEFEQGIRKNTQMQFYSQLPMSSCLKDNLRSFYYASLTIQFASVPREIGGGLGKFFLMVGIYKVYYVF